MSERQRRYLHTDGNLKVSASSIETFKQCPRKWMYIYVEDARSVSTFATILGTFAHSVLEEFYQWDPEERTVELAKEIARYEWDKMAKFSKAFNSLRLSEEEQKRMRVQAWKSVRGAWELEVPSEVSVLEVEKEFMMQHEGAWVRGFIDRVERDGDGIRITDYKGFPLDTPIPTPSGWVTMGELNEGDFVFDGDGKITTVTHKSSVHLNPCYQVSFDDGSCLVADHEHRWEVYETGRSTWTGVLTTEELIPRLRSAKNGQCHLAIGLPSPLDLPQADLPIPPYVLGVWLGDGTSATGSVTTVDMEVLDLIRDAGYHVGPDTCPGRSSSAGTYTVYGLRGQLDALGLLKNKHVPDLYLRASQEQRLELLRGLMDSDGGWNSPRSECQFNSSRPELASAVAELAASMGWKFSTWHGETKCTTTGVRGYAHYVRFKPLDQNPFKLTHKASLVTYPASASAKARRILITDVSPVETLPTQCITVSSTLETYLVGEHMTRTHNTGNAPKEAYKRDKLVQVELYALAAQELYEEPIVSAALMYLGKEIVQTEINEVVLRRTRKRLSKAIDAMTISLSTGVYEPKVGPLCAWCDFLIDCPEGQEEVFRLNRYGRVRKDSPGAQLLGL